MDDHVATEDGIRPLTLDERAFADTGPGFLATLVARDAAAHPPTWFLVNAYGAGDTYLVCALARRFREAHCGGAALAVVVKQSHLPIAQMFGDAIDRILVAPDDYLTRAGAHQARHAIRRIVEPGHALLMHPGNLIDSELDQFTLVDGVSQAHLFANMMRLRFPPQLALPVIRPAWRAAAERAAQQLGVVPGRSVILVPDANQWPALDEALWAQLAGRLSGLGWTVFTNVPARGGRAGPVPGTTAIDVPIGVFLALAERAGWVIGSICGLMHLTVAARMACKKTFVAWSAPAGERFQVGGVTLDSAYPYALQRTFDGSDYDVEYVDARADLPIAGHVEEIATGRNASFAYAASAEPVARMRLQVSPGEVIDKMTILEVKLERLPEEKRLTILGELAALRQTIVAAHGPLTGELKAAADRLRDLNRDAFDANEIMYRDSNDPLFTAQASQDDIAGHEQRILTCIRNMLGGIACNRERILVKNRINALLNCDWMERRSFKDNG